MPNEINLKEKSDLIHKKIMGLKLKADCSLTRIETVCPYIDNEEYAAHYHYERSGRYIVKIRVYVGKEKITVVSEIVPPVVKCSPVEVFLDTEEAVNHIESFLNSM